MKKKLKTIISFLVIFITSLTFLRAQVETDKIDALMKAYAMNQDFSGAVLVAKQGKVIYKNAFGMASRELDVPNSVDTKFRIASVSKTFTAMVVMKLVEEGKISLEGKLSDYLPSFPKEKGNKITIHQLLTHTSGMGHYADNPEYEKWFERVFSTSDEMITYFGNLDLLFEPGERYYYSSFGYDMLAYVCEKVTGKPFHTILKEIIFDPLEMNNTKLWDNYSIEKNAATGYEWKQLNGYEKHTFLDASKVVGGGGIITTVDDLLKWDQALYANKIINKENVSKIFQAQSKINDAVSYGYGWMLTEHKFPTTDEIIYFHGGSQNGFRCTLYRYTKSGYLTVILSNVHDNSSGGDSRSYNIDRIKNKIAAILFNEPYELPKRSAANEIAQIAYHSSAKKAIERYEALKNKYPERYYFSELELNKAGYDLLSKHNRAEDARLLLELNQKEFPESYNVYDSLGWLFKKIGNYKLALEYYKKGLDVYQKYPEQNKRWKRDADKVIDTITELEGLVQK